MLLPGLGFMDVGLLEKGNCGIVRASAAAVALLERTLASPTLVGTSGGECFVTVNPLGRPPPFLESRSVPPSRSPGTRIGAARMDTVGADSSMRAGDSPPAELGIDDVEIQGADD